MSKTMKIFLSKERRYKKDMISFTSTEQMDATMELLSVSRVLVVPLPHVVSLCALVTVLATVFTTAILGLELVDTEKEHELIEFWMFTILLMIFLVKKKSLSQIIGKSSNWRVLWLIRRVSWSRLGTTMNEQLNLWISNSQLLIYLLQVQIWKIRAIPKQ